MTADVVRRVETARLALLFVASVVGLLSASGVLVNLVFSRPTSFKYTLTVVFACYLIVVVCVRRPLRTMTAVTAGVAPFAATADIAGVPMTLGLITLAPAVLVLLVNRTTPWQSVEVRRSSLAFAVPCLAAALGIPLLNASEPLTWGMALVAMLGAGWLVASVGKDHANRRLIVIALVLGATVQAVMAVIEFLRDRPLDLYGRAATYATDYFYRYGNDVSGFSYRPSAGLPDPNSLGNILALVCPLILALAIAVQDRRFRALLALVGILNFVGLAVTFSRMSWIGATVGVLIVIASLPPRKNAAAALVVVACVVPAAAVALLVSGDNLSGRLATVVDPVAATTESRQGDLARIAIWDATVGVIGEHALVGVGLGGLPPYLVASVPNASYTTHAHSTYLNVTAEAGVVGGVSLLFLIFCAAKDCFFGLRSDRVIYTGIAGSLAAMLIVWSTDYTVRSIPVGMTFAMVVGLCAAASRRQVST